MYFNKDQATTITVDKKSSSFDVNIYRVDTNGELTVPLTFTPGEGNIYTVPASATFADGKNVATITISYDPEKLVYGEYTGGTITVGGEGIDTTYGVSAFTKLALQNGFLSKKTILTATIAKTVLQRSSMFLT